MKHISLFRKLVKLSDANRAKKAEITAIKKALADFHQAKALFSNF
ncbi:hypothetical protein V8Z79_06605 [Pantoea dispersa]|nr:hypothetical protein [Pantoea dispersa]